MCPQMYKMKKNPFANGNIFFCLHDMCVFKKREKRVYPIGTKNVPIVQIMGSLLYSSAHCSFT